MARKTDPRHFYLNEQHELTRGEREGGGSLPKLAAIDWSAKQETITTSLARAKRAIGRSQDPLRGQRYFLLAQPERSVRKLSTNKRKAPEGEYDEPVDYAGKDAKTLGRLGLDVVRVTELGAIVHASPEKFERLETIGANLQEVGRAEQARWAMLSSFDVIPDSLRADREWLDTLSSTVENEAIVELQPLLTRTESNLVLSTIVERLRSPRREAIVGSGTDFSGRAWVRVRLTLESIMDIVRGYFSVQSVHGPLLSALVQLSRADATSGDPPTSTTSPHQLPTVAIVDAGVPLNHPRLTAARRGTFIDPDSAGQIGSHGTFVASRVVFGDTRDPLSNPPTPTCQFLDVVVSRDAASVEDKSVGRSVNLVAANYPDVRTFNLSLGDYRAYGAYPMVERNERLLLTQDLDNIIFARDIIVVVAAGNSLKGALPTVAYPDHWRDPAWRLGHWALGFNTLTCGSFVRDWTVLGGIATVPFAPSPFSRVGPGLAEAAVPDFSAHGGNANASYAWTSGLGVYGLSLNGLWEDRIGTSFAAPILARECAFVFDILQGVCAPGSRPFAATVKALLALTAAMPTLPEALRDLAALTLGHGEAKSTRVKTPSDEAAIFVWQGLILDKSDIARVVFPVPLDWLTAATDPVCELAVAWDTPVNAAFPNVYGCRRVDAKIRALDGGKAARPSRGGNPSYPLRVRSYALKPIVEKAEVKEDLWALELSYEEICEYPPTQTFFPELRVGIALRLRDRAGLVSPQDFVQKHPLAPTMTRLSAVIMPAQVPVTIKPS
jgi:hypothetical protein